MLRKTVFANLSARTNCANAAVSRVPAAAAEAAAVMNGLPYSGIEYILCIAGTNILLFNYYFVQYARNVQPSYNTCASVPRAASRRIFRVFRFNKTRAPHSTVN